MILEKNISPKQIWEMLAQITDPEIPVISIVDLGIVRNVRSDHSGIEIFITPTYSGCPAMDVISMNIRIGLLQKGLSNIKITQQLSPAWTTDWMTENGKAQLKAYGIAPPQTRSHGSPSDRISKLLFNDDVMVECPQCHSKNTTLLSQFGSTACKALYQCQECKEPFDYFKCH